MLLKLTVAEFLRQSNHLVATLFNFLMGRGEIFNANCRAYCLDRDMQGLMMVVHKGFVQTSE